MAPVTVLATRAPPQPLALRHACPNVRSVYVCKWRSFTQLSGLNTQSAIPQVRPKALELKYNGGTAVRLPAAGVDQLNLASAMPSGPRLEIALPRAAISHAFAYSIRVLSGSKGHQQERRQEAEFLLHIRP